MQNEYEKEAQGQIIWSHSSQTSILPRFAQQTPHSSAWLPRAFAPLLVHPKLEKDRIKRHTDNHVWAFYATFSPKNRYLGVVLHFVFLEE